MDVSTLATLRNEYPTSSWAIWSSEYPEEGCIEEDPTALYEFIQENREKLRPSIVLLSLNPSTELPSSYQNFHSTNPKHRNDQFRDLVEEAGLEGVYMTDLVERTVDSDSGNVAPTSEDVENLLDQLDLLGQDHYQILCFHEKVFQTLLEFHDAREEDLLHEIRAFRADHDGLQLEYYRVWFHANWGVNRDKIQDLQEQLSYLNSKIINGGLTDLSRWLD